MEESRRDFAASQSLLFSEVFVRARFSPRNPSCFSGEIEVYYLQVQILYLQFL
jgi:hypothetical protein